MKRLIVLSTVAGLSMALAAQAARNQPEKKPATPAIQPTKPDTRPAQPARPDTKAPEIKGDPRVDMEKWEKANQPGGEHKALNPMIGEWDAAVRAAMMAGEPMTESKGSTKNEWVLDGRFVQSHYSGEMGGRAFTGISYLGYNMTTKKYESTWMDSTGTGIMMMTGDMDPKTHTMTFTGTYDDPMSGGKKNYKSITRFESNDRMIFTMTEVGPDGKDIPALEIVYTRKGAAHKPDAKPEVKPDTKAPTTKPGK